MEELKQYLAGFGATIKTWIVFTSIDRLPWATRSWWLLKQAGWENVSILGEHELNNMQSSNTKLATTLDVETALATKQCLLIDVRPPSDFNGTSKQAKGPMGHIPDSINIPIYDLLDKRGELASQEILEQVLAGIIDDHRPIITTCGGGIAATTLAFALALFGRTDVSVYDGSMVAWVYDKNRPVNSQLN